MSIGQPVRALDATQPAGVSTFDVTDPAAPWPAECALELGSALVDLDASFGSLPTGPWERPPAQALVVPIAQPGQAQPTGFFVAGLNPFRRIDAPYRSFIELLVGQVEAGIANARAYEAERQRATALAELDRAKTTFFSNVSHEFRTPLTLLLRANRGSAEQSHARLDGARARYELSQCTSPAEAGERPPRLRAHRGRTSRGALRPDQSRPVHRRYRQRVPLRLRTGRTSFGRRVRRALGAGVRGPRPLRKSAAQPLVERAEVHVRGRRDRAASGTRSPRRIVGARLWYRRAARGAPSTL